MMTKYVEGCEPGQKQRANHTEPNDNPTGVIITKRGNTQQNKERGRATLADLKKTLEG
jgi:hypothetical protein